MQAVVAKIARVPWLLAAMVALVLLTRLPFIGHPAPDYDEQLYDLIGRRMLTGALPYVDLWDRKPIGLFLIYAFAHLVGGLSPLAYQLLAMLFCLAGCVLTFALAKRITDPASAAAASLLYPLLMAIYSSHSGQSEIFFTPMVMGVAALLLHGREAVRPMRWFLAAMALSGLALQVKYTALPACAVLGCAALWSLHSRGMSLIRLLGTAALFALLGLLPTLLAAAFYAAHGQLGAFLFANFVSIGRRTQMPLEYTLFKQLTYIAPLAFFAAGGAIYGLGIRKPSLPPSGLPLGLPPRLPYAWWLALAWLLAATAGLFMGSTVYPYYYAALVPAAILVALPMIEFAHPRGALFLLIILGWLLATYNPPKLFGDARRERLALAELARTVAPAIGRDRGCLYVYDGPTALYTLSDATLPTRLIYPDHLNNALEARALPVDPIAEVARILAEAPGAIVTAPQPVTVRNAFTARLVSAALLRDYRLADAVTFEDRRIEAWLRRTPRPPAARAIKAGCTNSVSESSKLASY